MATLPFDALELVSCTRTVPQNGSPSSQDYNDTQAENLIDHAAMADAINTLIRPVLMQLSAAAATRGLVGDTVFTDVSDLTALCFNPQTNQALTIKESLQYLQAIGNALQLRMSNIESQVGIVSSQLSSTNQNSIALSLQNFQTALNQQANSINALQALVIQPQSLLTYAAQSATPVVNPSGQENVVCLWPVVLTSDSYTVNCSVEDPSGFLTVANWSYIPGGQGVSVVVSNSDPNSAHSGVVHACAFISRS